MVRISYSLTPEDLECLAAESRAGIPRRILKITFGVLLGSMGLLTAWQALFFFPWYHPFRNFILAGLGLVFLWMGLDFPGLRWISRRLSNPFATSEVQVLEGKLVYSCGGKTKQFRWLPKRGFSESEMFFYLRAFQSDVRLTIPKRALTSEQERSLRELAERESAERTTGSGDEVTSQFFLTQEELDESSTANHRWVGKYRKVGQRILCGSGVLVVAWAPWLIGKSWTEEFRSEPGLTVCAIGVGLFYLWAATGCVGLKKLSGMDQERSISVGDAEVSVTCGTKTKIYKWIHFSSYQETQNLFLLRTQSVEYWTIPKRALAARDLERLRTVLDRKLPQYS